MHRWSILISLSTIFLQAVGTVSRTVYLIVDVDPAAPDESIPGAYRGYPSLFITASINDPALQLGFNTMFGTQKTMETELRVTSYDNYDNAKYAPPADEFFHPPLGKRLAAPLYTTEHRNDFFFDPRTGRGAFPGLKFLESGFHPDFLHYDLRIVTDYRTRFGYLLGFAQRYMQLIEMESLAQISDERWLRQIINLLPDWRPEPLDDTYMKALHRAIVMQAFEDAFQWALFQPHLYINPSIIGYRASPIDLRQQKTIDGWQWAEQFWVIHEFEPPRPTKDISISWYRPRKPMKGQ
ncbi:MAG: hypothetical protein M1833_005850 [Piccolia ochrophora]|nr:MAG: hypothetical protein M1833_005850 [Piccolia ochrophora]